MSRNSAICSAASSSSSTRSGRASTGTSSAGASAGVVAAAPGDRQPEATRLPSVRPASPPAGLSGAELGGGDAVDRHRDPFPGGRPPDEGRHVGPQLADADPFHGPDSTAMYTGGHTEGGTGGAGAPTVRPSRQPEAVGGPRELEEQDELRRITRAFLESKSSEAEVRRLMDTTEGYDPKVWSQMANELGLQSLTIPEEYGGQGFTYVEPPPSSSKRWAAPPLCAPYFSSVVLAANAVLHSGDEAAKKDILPGIASGETIATLAFTEPNGCGTRPASRPPPPARTATPGKLNGTKMFVLDGHVADRIIVAARTGAGVSFSVAGDASGLTRTPLSTMDQTRKQAKLELADVPATLIGTDGVLTTLDRVLDLAAVSLAAEQVGGAFRLRSRWPCSTPRTGAAVRPCSSARSRPSSTSAPTCCSRSSRPSRPPTTPPGAPPS